MKEKPETRNLKPEKKSPAPCAALGRGMRPLSGLRFQISSFSPGFTLIEVLVASAILAFLLVVFLSVASFSSQAWRGSQQKMEEFSTARIVMNRIRSDIESIVIRPDLPLFPNNTMGFMTAKRGNTNDARLLSYVEYSTNANQVILSSRAYNLQNEPPFSTNSLVPAPPTTSSSTLAGGVIGFTNTYLNKDGTWSAIFNSKYHTNTTISTNPTVAVRVSLLVVSSDYLKATQFTNDMTLTDGVTSGEEQWNAAINQGNDMKGRKLDLRAARSLRAFERVFFLPN